MSQVNYTCTTNFNRLIFIISHAFVVFSMMQLVKLGLPRHCVLTQVPE
jgi:hypothetical protein